MKGILSDEIQVKVEAREAWKVFGPSLQLAKLVEKQLSTHIHRIDVLEGHGDLGTLLKLTFQPDIMFPSYNEKFTKIDNENMVKEVDIIEGGYLDLGFTFYRMRFEIIDTTTDGPSCIVRGTIEFHLKKEYHANASIVRINSLMDVINIGTNYLLQNQTTQSH